MAYSAGLQEQAARARLLAAQTGPSAVQFAAARSLALETSQTVDIPSRLFFERAEGPWLYDVEGRRFLDMLMGFGVHLLGHRPPAVQAALEAQVRRGWHFGLNNDLQARLAGRIAGLGVDQPKVLFCGSGSEATAYALRLARGFTGRERVAVFEGAYHGSHDYALVRADPTSDPGTPASLALGAGIPQAIPREAVMVLPFRSELAFELIRRHGRELAAVIVQPIQNNLPRLDMAPFLAGLREACDSSGALLVFDEVVTGLRLGLHGGQGRFDVRPDITAYGKAIGGGLPVGAVAGRQDIMELLPRPNADGGVFSAGTFNANPLTMAAGLATIEELERTAEVFYPRLEVEADRLAAAINAYAEARQLPVRMMNAASMLCLYFQRTHPESARDVAPLDPRIGDAFSFHMLDRGVVMPAHRMVMLSGAHETGHVDTVIRAVTESLEAMRADGRL